MIAQQVLLPKIQQDLALVLVLPTNGLILQQKGVFPFVQIGITQTILQEKIYAPQIVQEIIDSEIIPQWVVLTFVHKVTKPLVILLEINVYIRVLVGTLLK